MKNLFVIITLVMSGFVFNGCTDEVEDPTPQIEVEEVTAPDGDGPKDRTGGDGGGN